MNLNRRWATLYVITLGLALQTATLGGEDASEPPLPKWQQVDSVLRTYFESREGYQPGDLIARSEVTRVMTLLQKVHWKPSDRDAILKDTLSDGHVLVRSLQSQSGRRFMRKVQRDPLVYSKLDRISREQGGDRLIRDLVRLPDGHRYASSQRPRGVPGMVDLLPKRGSSRQPAVKNYNRATGRIYTEEQLRKRLQITHAKDLAAETLRAQ